MPELNQNLSFKPGHSSCWGIESHLHAVHSLVVVEASECQDNWVLLEEQSLCQQSWQCVHACSAWLWNGGSLSEEHARGDFNFVWTLTIFGFSCLLITEDLFHDLKINYWFNLAIDVVASLCIPCCVEQMHLLIFMNKYDSCLLLNYIICCACKLGQLPSHCYALFCYVR